MHKTDTPAPVGATVTEVLHGELCSMEQREAEDARRLEALRAAVQLGAAGIAAGRFKSFDTKASLRTSGLLAAVKVMPGQRFDSKSLQWPSTTFNCT